MRIDEPSSSLATIRETALETLAFAALAAALEAIGAPAFVLDPSGSVAHANSAGRILLDRDPRLVREVLRDNVAGPGDPAFSLTRIVAAGAQDHWLAIGRSSPESPWPRVALWTARHSLTPRQSQVLGLLVRGTANKTIAAELGCAEGTVELHVTRLLHKSGCQTRAQLVAHFWTDPR